jgi:hypothetical protein
MNQENLITIVLFVTNIALSLVGGYLKVQSDKRRKEISTLELDVDAMNKDIVELRLKLAGDYHHKAEVQGMVKDAMQPLQEQLREMKDMINTLLKRN